MMIDLLYNMICGVVQTASLSVVQSIGLHIHFIARSNRRGSESSTLETDVYV